LSLQTTFLNYVLTARHGKKIAVIQNEFGIGTLSPLALSCGTSLTSSMGAPTETGADAAVVFGKDGTQSLEYFELPNGCVCCSVRSEP
jgi:G3E family GTPase